MADHYDGAQITREKYLELKAERDRYRIALATIAGHLDTWQAEVAHAALTNEPPKVVEA